MAVLTRYIVERNGEEKMVFTDKKEADAYDKELDIAENLEPLLAQADASLSEDQLETLSLYMARHRDDISTLLKGSKPAKKAPKKAIKNDATDAHADTDVPADTHTNTAAPTPAVSIATESTAPPTHEVA